MRLRLKKLTNDIDEDVVLTELTKLFNVSKGSLGSPPKDQKVLESIYKDGEFRAKNKIPPSFEDILEAQKKKK
ncbi:PIN-like domain-containing protein [Psychrobacter sp. JCM 18900]|uniref:PIN-like domain-containing protein n=1 Tax=Psychrobacter sp. JCM 18900 TaxID=1298608 RepID=UPI0026788609